MISHFIVTETEWWDRIAMAVDRLAVLPGTRARAIPPEALSGVTAHVFDDVRDVETLRRLTQMPDETPSDMLRRPFAVYCPDMKSFVSVNDPSTPLEAHLKILEESHP
jgi:hypothetical protein